MQEEIEQDKPVRIKSLILAYYLLICCYLALGQDLEAMQELSILIELAEQNPDLIKHRLITKIYQSLSDTEEAQNYFNLAQKLANPSAQSLSASLLQALTYAAANSSGVT